MASPSTVSLPGGGKTVFHLPVATDASAALTTAIKSEFTAAGKNFTMNIVDSGKAGKAHFFNAVVSDAAKASKILAGTGVQAIFDQAASKDTLVGGKSTTLIYADATSKAGASISVVGTTNKSATTVFGGNGADTLTVTTGNATAYLEGTGNKVTLAGTTDTLSLAGSGAATVTASASKGATIFGGSGKVSIAGGVGTLHFTNQGGADTVNVKNKIGGDTLAGGLTSKGTDVFNLTIGTSGKYVVNSFGSKDKITGLTAAQAKAALAGAHTVKSGGSIVTTLTIGKDTITVTGVAVTKTNFT
jgi:hypothetical protein